MNMLTNHTKKLPVDIECISDFYNRGISNFGAHAIQAVCWSSSELALQCYYAVSQSKLQDWNQIHSVLDFGSGQGHLLPFIRQMRGFRGQYLGVELIPEFHDVAMQLYATDKNAKFICTEFLSHGFQNQIFDWVISLGSFGVAQPQQEKSDITKIRKISTLARRGFSIYLNDVNKMASVPKDLAAHDLDKFSSLILDQHPDAQIDLAWFPTPESYQSVIHVLLNEWDTKPSKENSAMITRNIDE